MEEQRARQEDEARKAVAASVSDVAGTVQKMEGMYMLASKQQLLVITSCITLYVWQHRETRYAFASYFLSHLVHLAVQP